MIESDEIEAAQESWGKAVVGVGAASSWEEAHGLAVKLDAEKAMAKATKVVEQLEAIVVQENLRRQEERQEKSRRNKINGCVLFPFF